MIRLAIIILFSLFLSQESISFNYESKYGNGTNVNDGSNGEESPYSYFENLLDVNFSYKNLFIYTQLEYSNSPIYGVDRIEIENLANTYNVEYSHLDLVVKYGHIQSLYGYGLSVNMFQDQTTDFDNRVKGVEIKYSPYDMFDIFYISGKGNYGIKSSADKRINNLLFDHELDLLGTQFYTDFGDISFIYSDKKTYYLADIYDNLKISDTRIANDLEEYWLTNIGDTWNNLIESDSEVNLRSFNIGYGNSLGNFDLYLEYDINSYNKILRDKDINGASKFLSIATEMLGVDFLYEFKDYDMVYYMPITSSPPLVFNESSSVLISRNQHSIDFSDEIGHQFESRFNLTSDISFLMNLSIGRKHSGIKNELDIFDENGGINFDENGNIIYGIYTEPTFKDLYNMNFLDKDLVAHKPFRDFYIEGSGWNKNNNIYFKLGYQSHYSYDNVSGKNYQSNSIPTQFVYAFKNNNSFTCYYETQQTKNLSYGFSNEYTFFTDEYEYMSLSYHFNKFGSLSYFIDSEYKESIDKSQYWTGWEMSFELSSSMQFSIFQGSQKGGLVCANGICAVQPSFEDGTKMTFRVLF
jgi:hypothetical protein